MVSVRGLPILAAILGVASVMPVYSYAEGAGACRYLDEKTKK